MPYFARWVRVALAFAAASSFAPAALAAPDAGEIAPAPAYDGGVQGVQEIGDGSDGGAAMGTDDDGVARPLGEVTLNDSYYSNDPSKNWFVNLLYTPDTTAIPVGTTYDIDVIIDEEAPFTVTDRADDSTVRVLTVTGACGMPPSVSGDHATVWLSEGTHTIRLGGRRTTDAVSESTSALLSAVGVTVSCSPSTEVTAMVNNHDAYLDDGTIDACSASPRGRRAAGASFALVLAALGAAIARRRRSRG